jgi:hypothetical protein
MGVGRPPARSFCQMGVGRPPARSLFNNDSLEAAARADRPRGSFKAASVSHLASQSSMQAGKQAVQASTRQRQH